MPRGDGTGPMGQGPLTGRGAGYCAGFAAPGFNNFGGCGYGRGRGFRRSFYEDESVYYNRFNANASLNSKELLKRRSEILEAQLQQVKEQLLDLDEK